MNHLRLQAQRELLAGKTVIGILRQSDIRLADRITLDELEAQYERRGRKVSFRVSCV